MFKKLLIIGSLLLVFAYLFPQAKAQTAFEYLLIAKQLNGREAIPYLDSVTQICKTVECSDSIYAKLYHRRGVAFFQGYIDDELALAYTDTSLFFYKKYLGDAHILVANQLYNKGVIAKAIGEYSIADSSVTLAFNMLQKLEVTPSSTKDSIILLWSYEICKLKNLLGDSYEAANFGEIGLRIAIDRNHNPSKIAGQIFLTLGNLYYRQGLYEKSITYLNQARYHLELRGQNEPYTLSSTLILLGLNHAQLGLLLKSSSFFSQASKVYHESLEKNPSRSNKSSVATLYLNLMWFHLIQDEWDDADHYYQEALRLSNEVYPHTRYPIYADLHLQKAQMELRRGNYPSALDYLNLAQAVITPTDLPALEEPIVLGPIRQNLDILSLRAEVLEALGQEQAALDQYELLSSYVTQSRRSYQANLSKYFLIQKVQPAYERAMALCLRLHSETGQYGYLQKAYSYNARNKAILLLEALQSERAMQFSGIPQSLLDEEAQRRQALADQEAAIYRAYQNDQATDSLETVLFEAQQAYRQFITSIERDFPAFYELKYAANEPPLITDLQASLDPNRALLEYFVGKDSIYTFVFTNGHSQVFRQAIPTDFENKVEWFRELMTNGLDDDCEQDFIRLAQEFYQLLLAAPLNSLSDSFTRLLIVPDGLLNYIAFESLLYKPISYLQGADGFVLERFAFSYAYSSKLLLQAPIRPTVAPGGFAGFGLEYDDVTLEYLRQLESDKFTLELDTTSLRLPCGLEDTTRYLGKLLFSDDEVRNIAELLGGDSWLNEAVTKAAFENHAQDYRLLHLAMHGSYDMEYPMNSSLVFTRKDSTDIFLRAAEIYGMQFNSDLVVLSACNTAYGRLSPGEGPMTMARAFHYAGIPSVVASLWSIPDRSASHIMYLFYEFLDQGLRKDEAMQQAKLAYLTDNDRSSPSSRQPVHWAPAVVIGDVMPIEVPGHRLPWVWIAVGLAIAGVGAFAWQSNTKAAA